MGKKIKKSLAIMLCLVMMVGSVPLSGFVGLELPDWSLDFSGIFNTTASAASYSGSCGTNVTYTLNTSTGELVISGSGDMTDYGYSSMPWYSYRSSIKSVDIENGVTSIGNYAFYYCANLTSVTIGDSVTSIGYYAFRDCTNLTSITIPDSVTSIGNYAFYYCSNLTSITIGDSVTSIGDWAFAECYSLASITFGDSVTSIGSYAFNSTNLTSITIGDSVTSIGDSAFNGCSELSSVNYGGTFEQWSLISIGSNNSYLTSAYYTSVAKGYCGDNLIWSFDSTTGTLTISGSGDMTDYGYSSMPWYSYRSSILSIEIENGVTNIGNYAFNYCTNLTSVTIGDSVTSIGNDAFSSCSSLRSLVIPDSVETIGSDAFSWCYSLTNVTFGDSITNIGGYAFYCCRALEKISFGYSIPIIEQYAFYSTCLSTIEIDDSNTEYLAEGLTIFNKDKTEIIRYLGTATTYTIPEGVTSIADYAFYYCTNLRTLYCGESLIDIGEYAFGYCEKLTSIELPDSLETIQYRAFAYCSKLSNVDLGNNVSYIGTSAFWYCKSLKSIEIPESVTYLGSRVFYKCTALTSVDIKADIDSIYVYTFCYCSNLMHISIPQSVTSISSNAFGGCTNLTVIEFDSTLENWNNISLGSNNSALNSASLITTDTVIETTGSCGENLTYKIEDGVLTISGTGDMDEWNGNNPWAANLSIETVIIEEGVTSISEEAFEKCLYIKEVSIASSVESIGAYAFYKCIRLAKITILNSDIKVGSYAFGYCSSLDLVIYNGTQTQFNNLTVSYGNNYFTYSYYSDKFYINTDLTFETSGICGEDITWSIDSDGVLTITGSGAMFDWESSSPWYNNTNITSVVISDGITSIGDRAFVNCTSLETVYMPDSITTIGSYAFLNCLELDNITFSVSLTEIKNSAFRNCYTLKSVYIYPTLEEIGSKAFYECGWLETVYYVGDKDDFDSINISSYNTPLTKADFSTVYCDHVGVAVEAIEATCVKDGLTAGVVCEKCGAIISGCEVIPATGIEYIVTVVEPTCTTDGYTIYTCACDIFYDVDNIVPATGHTYVTEVTDSTCTSQGYTTYTCSVCGDSYVDDYTDIIEHTLYTSKEAVAATCTTDGSTAEISCSVCNEVITESETIEATGHTYYTSSEAVAATCTEAGSTAEISCSVCKEVTTASETIAATGHSYGEWITTTEATETSEGEQTRTCSVCGTTDTQTIPELTHEHTYTTQITAPTCTEQGYTTHTCSCEYYYIDNFVEATGHTYYTSAEAVEPTCIADGSTEEISCSVCNTVTTASETIAATGHTYYTSAEATAATCTTEGSTEEISCSVCKEVTTASETIAATGHSYGEWTTTTEATETTEGEQTRTCSVCGKIETQTIPELTHEHTYTTEITAPTCTEKGYTTYTCTCGDSYTADETEALGHTYYTTKEAVAVTCTTDGSTAEISCSVCNEVITESETIVALGHTYYTSKDAVAATCTTDGSTAEISCSVCNEVITASEVIPATGHTFGEWITTTEATETTEGEQTRICSICGVTEIQTIDKLALTEVGTVSNITVENGSTWLQISWSEATNATGYQIYVDGTKVATLYDGETTYKISSLSGATDYEVCVRSFAKVNITTSETKTYFGDYSDTYTFTTNPFKASFSSYSCTYDAVRVNWNAVDGADGYRLYMYVDGVWETVATVSSSTLTYRIDGLDANTEYLFKVKAYTRDVSGVAQFGVSSNEYTASTKSTTVQLTSYTNTTSAIRINWSEISVADGYRIYLYRDGSWVNMGTVYGSDTTTFKLTGLDDGTIYKFKVKAFIRDDSGTAIWQDASDEYMTMTDLGTAKISSSSTTSSAIRINWSEVDGATGYKIYMLVDGKWITYDTIYDGDITTYRFSGLDSNTTYQFKICAFSKDVSPVVWGTTSSIYSVTTSK